MIAELERLADTKMALEATKRAVRAGAEVVFDAGACKRPSARV